MPPDEIKALGLPGVMDEFAAMNRSESIDTLLKSKRHSSTAEESSPLPLHSIESPEIQLFEVILRLRYDLSHTYSQESVAEVFLTICMVRVPVKELVCLASLFKRFMVMYDTKPHWKENFHRHPTTLLLSSSDYLRKEDFNTIQKALESLSPRLPSWADKYQLFSISMALTFRFSYASLRQQYPKAQAGSLFWQAYQVRKQLQCAVFRLTYQFTFESMCAFYDGLCDHLPPRERKLMNLASYLEFVNWSYNSSEEYARMIKLDPMMPFRDAEIQKIYGETRYQKLMSIPLQPCLGILGELPKVGFVMEASKSLFQSVALLSKISYSSLSEALGERKANEAYSHAFEIQCTLNEIAHDLLGCLPTPRVRALHEAICDVVVSPDDIIDLNAQIQSLRARWRSDSHFRLQMIHDPMNFLKDQKFARLYSIEKLLTLEKQWEIFWPWWTKPIVWGMFHVVPALILTCLWYSGLFNVQVGPVLWAVFVLCVLAMVLAQVEFTRGQLRRFYLAYVTIPKRIFLWDVRRKRASQVIIHSRF